MLNLNWLGCATDNIALKKRVHYLKKKSHMRAFVTRVGSKLLPINMKPAIVSDFPHFYRWKNEKAHQRLQFYTTFIVFEENMIGAYGASLSLIYLGRFFVKTHFFLRIGTYHPLILWYLWLWNGNTYTT